MSRIEVKLTGDGDVVRRLKAAPKKLEDNIQHSLNIVGFLVQREARKNAPFRDGDLERSISFKTGREYVDILVPINSPAGRYAKIRHYSKYKLGMRSKLKGARAGRLYIDRAIEDNEARIVDEFRTVLRGI